MRNAARAYINSGIGAAELFANVMGSGGRSRRASPRSASRTSGS